MTSEVPRPDALQAERLSQRADTTRIEVSPERVDMVLDTLMEAYREGRYPYYLDRVRVPQDERHMPQTLERGTKDHAMFFWNVCYYMRGGTKSTFAVQQMAELYDAWPELFDCAIAKDVPQEAIEEALKAHKLGFQKTVAHQWRENARRMEECYDGDPRLMFADLHNNDAPYETLLSRVKNDKKGGGFIGFREKMTSMIAYYLMSEELVEPFNFPIPVDLHVMRVSVANQLVSFPDTEYPANVYSEELLNILRSVYFDYAARRGVNPLELCNAVWLLSESLCGKAPGNQVTEPRGRENRKGRATLIVPEVIDLSDASQQQRYEQTCAKCPVEASCDLNVHGGAMYYALGRLVVRGARPQFPERTLFSEFFLHENS